MPLRVAIIGAGPSGLSQLHAFETARRTSEKELPELVCFEKQSDWGGLWRFNWRTGLDEHGEPIHCGMYRNLWINAPKECQEFGDYSFDKHFGKPILSYPPREIIYDYITTRAEKSGIRKYIQFDTVVKWVSFSKDNKKFTVVAMSQKENRTHSSDFDYVIVASGHFSTPNNLSFEGMDKFPGRIMHSHDFRDARQFAGKRVLIVGSHYSAEDIGLHCYKYGAKSVTFSYRKKPMGFSWPQTLKEVPILTKVEGQRVYFKDGSSEEVDDIILCTGYLHHFPYLSDNLRLRTNNGLYPPGLYKGIFWATLPQLIYLGMQDQFFSFNMFDVQAWYARDVILGKLRLPTQPEAMEADIAHWHNQEEKLEEPIIDGIQFQADYIRDLAQATDYPNFDFNKAADIFREWIDHKRYNVFTYRDNTYVSALTGTKSVLHQTPWLQEMNDDKEKFLN